MFKRVGGKLVAVEKTKTRDGKEIRERVLVKDGRVMAVVRPLTPAAAAEALAKAKALVDAGSDDGEAFQRVLTDQDRVIFMGLASTRARILDPRTLADLGPMEPGDSFVDYVQLMAAQEQDLTETA